MAFEHKAGTATLFRNDKKIAGDNLPDYKGEGKDMAGNPFEIAGWIRQGKEGSKFLSIKISAPFAPSGPAPQPATTARTSNASQVPFPVDDVTSHAEGIPDGSDLPF